jgi:hypothetical protein
MRDGNGEDTVYGGGGADVMQGCPSDDYMHGSVLYVRGRISYARRVEGGSVVTVKDPAACDQLGFPLDDWLNRFWENLMDKCPSLGMLGLDACLLCVASVRPERTFSIESQHFVASQSEMTAPKKEAYIQRIEHTRRRKPNIVSLNVLELMQNGDDGKGMMMEAYLFFTGEGGKSSCNGSLRCSIWATVAMATFLITSSATFSEPGNTSSATFSQLSTVPPPAGVRRQARFRPRTSSSRTSSSSSSAPANWIRSSSAWISLLSLRVVPAVPLIASASECDCAAGSDAEFVSPAPRSAGSVLAAVLTAAGTVCARAIGTAMRDSDTSDAAAAASPPLCSATLFCDVRRSPPVHRS